MYDGRAVRLEQGLVPGYPAAEAAGHHEPVCGGEGCGEHNLVVPELGPHLVPQID